MTWTGYVYDKFNDRDIWSIDAVGELCIVSLASSQADHSVCIIFLIKNNKLEEVIVRHSKSNLSLLYFSFTNRDILEHKFPNAQNFKALNIFLDSIIYGGWEEYIYLFEGELYKIKIRMKRIGSQIQLRKPLFKNVFFYLRLYANLIIKDFDFIIYSTPSIDEKTFLVPPLFKKPNLIS